MIERWPPVYDFEELKEQIGDLVASGFLFKNYYDSSVTAEHFMAGDVLYFSSPLPLVDSSGLAVGKGNFDCWLILSNTCDLQRSIAKVPYAICAPVRSLPREEVPDSVVRSLELYRPFRRYYLPPWSSKLENLVSFADLKTPASIHREAILRSGTVVARMNRESWILFHSCLVRFLARDDGRAELGNPEE